LVSYTKRARHGRQYLSVHPPGEPQSGQLCCRWPVVVLATIGCGYLKMLTMEGGKFLM
jgi:hypothetical protein